MEKSTSTSPSNRHLGHYKSLLSSDGTKQHSANTFSDTMWHIFSSLTNFAIHTTQLLDRRKTTIAIMLEKNKGSPKINRLRVIGKYEADYNLLLKLYWPKLTTQQAEREETLGKIQLGTRPHKSLNDASVINELIVDTCRILK